ncbi:MAG TPA: hypothetical protein PLF13_06205 [candidate division Zixibacteria bacterium]|nr:hypothetical protein [candidate division Zixibacteria bacterium]
MRKYSTVIAILVLLIASGSALAQEEEARDVLETCFYGGLGIPSGGITDFGGDLGAKTGWSLGIDIGYFMRYNVVVGVNFIYTQMAIDGGPEVDGLYHRLYNPNLYVKYYFMGESNFEPYIKAHVGVENPKFTTYLQLPDPKYHATSYDASLAYGIGAGVFYYSADYSGLFLEVNYHAAQTKDAEKSWDEQTVVFGDNLGMIDIHAGIRILIGSGE